MVKYGLTSKQQQFLAACVKHTMPVSMCRASANPTRKGLPKRDASVSLQIEAFVATMGGDRPIHRYVLVW